MMKKKKPVATFKITEQTRKGKITVSPKVGMGITICFMNDTYPATIVKVSPSGKTIWYQYDEVKWKSKKTGAVEKLEKLLGIAKEKEWEPVYVPNEKADIERASYRPARQEFRRSNKGEGRGGPRVSFAGKSYYRCREI